MLLRVIFVIIATLKLTTTERFNYSCELEKPEQDSTFPTISLNSLELQVSHRVTHQLVTRVFAIFLKEIYEFENIDISTELVNTTNKAPHEQAEEYTPFIELTRSLEPAINLEVWVTPDSHLMFPDTVIQGASLSDDFTRYGLFIQESFGSQSYSYSDFIAISSTYNEIIKDFKIDIDSEAILRKNVIKSDGFSGIFTPSQCYSETEPCAAVLTSHFEDTNFFRFHVDKLRLKMKVYFLGEKLPEVIRSLNSLSHAKLNKNNKAKKSVSMKFLILHWTPSEIINGKIKYKPLTMPSCDLYKDKQNNCRYDLIPVSVYFNDKVREKSDELMDIMRRLHFSSLQPLLDLYEKEAPEIQKLYINKIVRETSSENLEGFYNKMACKWLQENKEVYSFGNEHSWIKKSDELKKISIGGIFPLPGTGREYEGISTAISMAERFVNSNPKILPGYELQVISVSSECKPDLVLRRFINFYSHRKHLVGVLGPSCSEAVEPIAAISKHFKLSVITYSAEGVSFDEHEQYPYFFRTIGQSKQYEDVYLKLLTELNWKRIAALTEDSMKYTEYITNMEPKLREKNIELLVNRKFTRDNNREKQFDKFKTYLKELRDHHRAKIIIADVHDHILMKLIICAASKMKMTAQEGFVWFLPVYVSMKMNDTGFQDMNGTCSEIEMRNAMDRHFAFDYASFGNDLEKIDGGQTIEEWKHAFLSESKQNETHFAEYAPFVHDAIFVYVRALQQMIKEDSRDHRYMRNLYSDATMEKLASLINDMDFQGVSGRIQFVKGGSRLTDINVLQWQNNDFVQVGSYRPKIFNRTFVDGELKLTNRLSWHNGEKPEDGHESCTLKFIADLFGTDCQSIYTLLIIISCISVILLCSASSFLFWKRKYDKKLEKSEKFLGNYRNIVHGIELTKWEVPRENVVMNRRLGEGAFGTVYGGEALIDEEDGWTAVAIKTLKAGSNAENRLDFLAESETMKRFDHKNIVKLLAVCLQSEPLFAIMEYMLYGDLKTFLLARRHLVNEKLSDESDVSPKRLTLMALDIARGLSYLSSMNYIHRDIACRNCMINAQRIVKIGDFGMARPTFESDYYRFARKGMLPVRWMAPESLDGGIFSHGSDIWSYGVLLYEIVTLGAFPFQGLNNNEVFEHVKLGNSIKIPATCKPQLIALMNSCFSKDAKKRPGAATIVEFISNYPRMLTPIMDVPKPCLDDQVNLIHDDEDFEHFVENRDRSHTPAANNFLRTSVSSSALQSPQVNPQDPSTFDYLYMKDPKRPNGIYLNDYNPDLTAMLPNGNYNPVEPLLKLQTRPEISKSNLSLMKYVPMCGFSKNSNRSSPDECTSPL